MGFWNHPALTDLIAKTAKVALAIMVLSAFCLPGRASAQTAGPVSFRKVLLNSQFFSEGIHFGDLNRDNVQDIVSGPYWYPGPGFEKKLAFRTPRSTPFPVSGDSDCYSVWIWDFNGDGWPDILSLRVAGGSEAVWYENPKSAGGAGGAEGNWVEHAAFSPAENESASLLDMDGDGKPELITNSKGYGGWARPDWNEPLKPWTFRAVTQKGSWGQYTHGIGAGDINGDGRADLLFSNGWWDQPATLSDAPWVQHAAVFWGQAAPQEDPGGAQIRVYDVDGDGDNDVVTSLQAHGWGLAWFENKDKGTSFVQHMIMNTAAEKAQYGLAFAQLHALAVADLDGDGLQDIVTGKRKGAHGSGLGAELDAAAVLYWFRLTRPAGSAPRFLPYLIDSQAGIGTQLTVQDVNGDGSPDILTARRDGAFAFLNQQTFTGLTEGGFQSPGRSGGSSAQAASAWPSFWRFREWDALGRTGVLRP